jgi:hypothetical protein
LDRRRRYPDAADAVAGQRNAQNQPQALSASPELEPALDIEQVRAYEERQRPSHTNTAKQDHVAQQRLAVDPHQPAAKPAAPFFDFTQGALLDSFSFSAQAYSTSTANPSIHSMPLPPEQVQPGTPWLQALDSRAASASTFASAQHSPTDSASFHQPSTASSLSAQPTLTSQPSPNPLADALRRAHTSAPHQRHDSASSTSSIPSPAMSSPDAPFEDRLQFVLAAARSAGFDSLDALMLQYYTRPLDPRSPALLEARRRSRRRDLRQVLARLAEDVAGWSQWESQGFEDALMASAERIVRNEASAFALGGASRAGGDGSAAAGEAGAVHKARDERVSELRDEVSSSVS